jgi:diguanylate cyclase (GGDEF)-like protein/PAS domain S-box-containing protein
VASLVLLAPLVAVAGVSAVALGLTRSSAQSLDNAEQQDQHIEAAYRHVDDVRVLGAALLATGADDERAGLLAAEAAVDRELRIIVALPPLTAAQQALVARAESDWQSSAPLRQQVAAWAPKQPLDLVASVEDAFTSALKGVTGRIDTLRADNGIAVAALRDASAGLQTTSLVAVGIALLVGIVAALAVSARLSRTILRPVERLHAATDRLANGEHTEVLATDRDDELAGLARAFNSMADRLVERQRAVDLRERRLAALVENASDGILVVSAEGTVVFATPSLRHEFGIDDKQSESLAERVHPDDLENVIRAWGRVGAEPGASSQAEARLLHADGSWRHVWAKLTNRLADPAVAGVVFNITDVSERHEYEQQLTWQALHDPLTGLANRELLRRRLEHPPATGTSPKHSLLYLDFDDFKRVNDRLGHASGDSFLKEVGARIAQAVRPQDLVVRIGGDEFAVLLEATAARQAARAAQRVVTALQAALTLDDHEVRPSASLGIATVGVESTTLETLIGDADLAMYFAKRRGKGTVHAFEASMRTDLVEQVQLGEDLRVALESGALTVAYQPVVRLADGTVAGVEALARWEHPVRGAVPPLTFIPLAEQLGLIGRLDEWVLRQACGQARAWTDAGLPPIRVAVNISGRDLANADLPDVVRGILAETGLEADWLELELTESVAIAESDDGRGVMQRLKDLGVHLSIDDFGTGYSALGRLRSLPFDRLKVDKAFVDELRDTPGGSTLVETILEMAQALGMEVVAEGVETPVQAAFLRERSCELAQGFYFSRPVEPGAIEAMLRLGTGTATASARP